MKKLLEMTNDKNYDQSLPKEVLDKLPEPESRVRQIFSKNHMQSNLNFVSAYVTERSVRNSAKFSDSSVCLTPGISFSSSQQNTHSIRIKVLQDNGDGIFCALIGLTEASNLNNMQEKFYDQGKRTCYNNLVRKYGDGEELVKPSRW